MPERKHLFIGVHPLVYILLPYSIQVYTLKFCLFSPAFADHISIQLVTFSLFGRTRPTQNLCRGVLLQNPCHHHFINFTHAFTALLDPGDHFSPFISTVAPQWAFKPGVIFTKQVSFYTNFKDDLQE